MLFVPSWALADGPTPYPDPKDTAAWPGKGPIRCFGWMVDNRKAFWAHRDKDQGKIVLAGDSLTGGWNARVLAESLGGFQFANRGIGGDTSRGLLFRFKEDVLDLHPSAIVICIGSNDLSAYGKPADTESNVAAMIEQARQSSATVPIVLCLVPPRDAKDAPTKPGALEQVNARLRKLGEGKEHLLVLDTFAPFAEADHKPILTYFGKDRVHFNKAGYAKWAQLLKGAFEALGVKPGEK
jgi:lysophospholipase L1-like esterase